MTFSKKAQAAGVFHRRSTRASEPYRSYNTWMGDPIRALQASSILKQIRDYGLVDHTKSVGEKLYERLESLFEDKTGVSGLRGKGEGTFIAWDFDDGGKRDAFVKKMRDRGVQMGGCGEKSVSELAWSVKSRSKLSVFPQVRLRPMLIFGDSHADVLVETIDAVLATPTM